MKSSRTMHALCFRPLKRFPAAIALLAIAAPVWAEPGNGNRAPDLGDCEELQVEEGHLVAFSVYAEGVQIYEWDGASWVFVAPDAALYADDGGHGLVGTHFGGPTWESLSGSRVVGMVIESCTADPDAIDWLLLKKRTSKGPGIFARVTYLQRINTVGGLAPAEPGEFPGQVARVPYSADYIFYRALH